MYLLTAVHRNLCLRPASTIIFLHLSPATHVACLSKTSAATNLFQDFQFSSTQNINCLEVTLLGAGSSTGDSQILFSQYDPIQKSWSNALRPSQRPPLPPRRASTRLTSTRRVTTSTAECAACSRPARPFAHHYFPQHQSSSEHELGWRHGCVSV